LESYLAYFPSFELLTADEEIFFAEMAHRGESLGRDRLIMHNIRLVAAEALRYFKGKTSDDTQAVSVISEGVFGLMRAVERFDPSRGFRFSTYATHWIRRFIYRGSNGLRFIRLPHYIHGILARLGSTTAVLEEELGREPDSREMADALGQREGAYHLAVQAASNTNIIRPIVTDETREIGGVSDDYLDNCNECPKCVDPVDALLASEAKAMLMKALTMIDSRLATVVKMRYGVGCDRKYTLQEIGLYLNLSRERVRQLEAEGKNDLKTYLTEHGGDDL
jgi:RNA polymerase sigma factor (sigma-70 family)